MQVIQEVERGEVRVRGFALLIAGAMFLSSCEGPAGPAGTDGTNGVDGNVTCLVCHSDDNMTAVQQQFAGSQHSSGAIAVGLADQDIANPSPWECGTCHGLHTTFEEEDYALRMSGEISFIFDETVTADFGNGNLCVNCHQSRRAEPNVTDPGETFNITSTHYGPHHGPQGNVLNGVGFAEIAGDITYPAQGSSPHMGLSCTGCHMGDYDVEELLVELRDILVANGVLEWVEEDEAYEPVVGEHSMVNAQSFFNWIGLEEDRSLGVHNPKYVVALLKNSIKALG